MPATLFKPTKARIKANIQPTQPIGAPPMVNGQPVLRINESVTAVGDQTGTPYFRYGDNPNFPETVSVTNPGEPGPTLVGPDGAVSFANEGTAVIGQARDLTPADLANAPAGSSQQQAYQQGTASGLNPNPAPQAQQPGQVNVGSILGGLAGPQGPASVINSNQRNVYASQGQGINASQGALNAQGGVLQATANTFPATQGVIDARNNVVTGQQQQNQMQTGYLQNTLAENQTQRGALTGIQAASQNVADQSAVARAQNYRDNTDFLYGAAGLSRPRDIDTPTGADTKGLPPGVRANLQTQEQLLTRNEVNRANLAKLDLAAQAIGVDLKGASVRDLELIAARAGLTLDQAQLAVSKASNILGVAKLAESNANLNTERATLTLNESKLAPNGGVSLYVDRQTGNSSWMTQAQQDAKDAEYKRAFELTQPGTKLFADPVTGVQSYETQDAINKKMTSYNQYRQVETAATNEQARIAAERIRDSQTPLGGLSDEDVVALVYTTPQKLTRAQALDELTRRRLSPAAAVAKIELGKPRRGGSGDPAE